VDRYRPSAMRIHPLLIAVVGVLVLALAGCGKSDSGSGGQPVVGIRGGEKKAAQGLGFPTFATKNTTRVGGGDPIADAAAVARAVYPAVTGATRPDAVTLVDQRDWRAAVAASVLMSRPVRAPVLFADGKDLPAASDAALEALGPTGARSLAGAQVVRIGNVAKPSGFKTRDLPGGDPYTVAGAIDRAVSGVRGAPSDAVVVASADAPEYTTPSAGWAAKSGDPVLFVKRDVVPPATVKALKRHDQPKIYVLGPSKVVGEKVLKQLRKLGKVQRISGDDPVRNAIAFARFVDGNFGWGVVDPGHGLVFASQSQPLAAAAAAPLSASGKYGPLLLVDTPDNLPRALSGYLLDIQPGYRKDPVRGVYNHAWVIGDDKVMSTATQARIDALLEITPVDRTNASQ
jgi:hypothetical protein